MIIYVLGILTGLATAVLLLIGSKRHSQFIQKIAEVEILPKQKAEILETATESQEAIAEVMKENEAKGQDTPIDEL